MSSNIYMIYVLVVQFLPLLLHFHYIHLFNLQQGYIVLIYLHLGMIKKDCLTAIWIKIYYTTCLFKVCVCV